MMRHMRGHIRVRRWWANRQRTGLRAKLPDGNNRAQTEKRVNDSFHNAPAFFFRADQQPVCRLSFVVHNFKTPPSAHFV